MGGSSLSPLGEAGRHRGGLRRASDPARGHGDAHSRPRGRARSRWSGVHHMARPHSGGGAGPRHRRRVREGAPGGRDRIQGTTRPARGRPHGPRHAARGRRGGLRGPSGRLLAPGVPVSRASLRPERPIRSLGARRRAQRARVEPHGGASSDSPSAVDGLGGRAARACRGPPGGPGGRERRLRPLRDTPRIGGFRVGHGLQCRAARGGVGGSQSSAGTIRQQGAREQ